jgi:HK97 family phage major capsid protein/HK97 family phage prohead protease
LTYGAMPGLAIEGGLAFEALLQERKGNMPWPNFHSCRLRNPDDFKKDSFRYVDREHEGKKYSVVMGKLKNETTMTEQSYRYPKESWTASEAKSHCDDHDGILFEPAKSEKALEQDLETRTFKASDLRAYGGKAPRIEGKIPYGSESENLGGFIEVLKAGCFSESIRSGDRILSFWGHDDRKPLGSTEAGTLVLNDKASALHFTIFPPDTTWGHDAVESVRRGDTTGASFGFRVPNGGDKWREKKGGVNVREIHTAKLMEISPVSWPAYQATSVQVRRKPNMENINELYEARNKIVKEQRAILDRAHDEGREVTAEERAKYESLDRDFLDYTERIKRAEGKGFDSDLMRRLEEREEFMKSPRNRAIKPEPIDDYFTDIRSRYGGNERNLAAEMRTFNKLLRVGYHGLNRDEQREFEVRALQMDVDPAGGYLVTPEQFTNSILAKLKDMVFVRQYATLVPCPNAHSLGEPALDNEPDDGEWTAEPGTGSEDTSMDFDKRAFYPHPIAKRIKISNKLLRTSTIAVDAFVRDRLAYKFAIPEEKCFLGSDADHGTGSNQPLGLMTVSSAGISSSRDVSAGNTATAIGADGLINAFYTLKSQYRSNARWIFHRDALKQIRKLKDGQGNYLFGSGLANGRPDTILGKPFDESEYMLNTFSAGELVGIVGDFSFYHIADALDMQIQVLTELYAETNQTGYIGRKETDGMPVFEEAFVRIKLGT